MLVVLAAPTNMPPGCHATHPHQLAVSGHSPVLLLLLLQHALHTADSAWVGSGQESGPCQAINNAH